MKQLSFLQYSLSLLGRSIILTVLILILIVSAHSCYTATQYSPAALPEGYPTREVVDTKSFDRLRLSDSLALVVVDAYYAAFPNEMGLCIYGRYALGTIFVSGLRADSTRPAQGAVQIFCTEEEADDPILGDVHSHPGARNPAYPCFPSQQDYLSLLVANHGVMVIYCANGSGVTVFRDGRWWNFAWR